MITFSGGERVKSLAYEFGGGTQVVVVVVV